MKDLTCLQLWMMLLMSNLVNYIRLFKVSIKILQASQIMSLIKTLSEQSQCVGFTLVSMKHYIN